ncbi:hypothetical protein F4804DRAFT_347658 [Jackrogersella minutella]|nr:hypothetical protein F4804DRAFT_347658 [Jackrogersella minutella]
MGPTIESISDLRDEKHPNLELTELNKKSVFFKLPIEVRLIIYEFAVYVDKPIVPRQVKKYSNKFVWGDYITSRSYDFNDELTECRESTEQELMAVSLFRTCRAMFADLECWHPFYKVNLFEFHGPHSLHLFLAAITPQRRRKIRWIDILHEPSSLCLKSLDKKLLALLSQCKDLKTHRLKLTVQYHELSEDGVVRSLTRCLEKIQPQSHSWRHYNTWSLPFFHLEFHLHPDHSGSAYIPIVVTTIKRAITLHRKRENIEEGGPQWFKDMAEDRRLQEDAIAAANIQFPGEERLALSKASSSIGPISSRTRGKCQVPDPMGTTKRSIPEYNEEGTVTGRIDYVTEIRWNGTDIQVKVVWPQPSLRNSTWENLSAILDSLCERHIRRCYLSMQYCRYRSVSRGPTMDRNNLVDKIKNMPSPGDIVKVAGNFSFLDNEVGKKRANYVRGQWRELIGEWNSFLKQLAALKNTQVEAGGEEVDGEEVNGEEVDGEEVDGEEVDGEEVEGEEEDVE